MAWAFVVSYFYHDRYIVFRKLWIPLSHPFGIVELFLGSTVTETLRSLVSKVQDSCRSHPYLLYVIMLCLDTRTILHSRNTRFWQRESLVSLTMRPWISDSPERRHPNVHTCYIRQLHFPLFYYTEARSLRRSEDPVAPHPKLLYTHHTHQN